MADDAQEEYWFADGLRFTCTQCGKCCTGEPGFVWLTEEELERIAHFRREPLDVVRAVYTRMARNRRTLREAANGDCVFWSATKGCTVYPVRPAQCRTWPFWESNLNTPDDWQRTVDICPGSGEGELIPVEEILKRMHEVKV
ncbi:MAG: YkgJ family cysteine cluster protein [Bacteroidales bacterium]|nr:YkgJ family cysteine cluster protein [Bacteroidales bacterium]